MMKRVYRSFAHNYSMGGVPLVLTKIAGTLKSRIWSTTDWIIYEQVTAPSTTTSQTLTQRQALSFADLISLGYSKAKAFPEDIHRRYARGDLCHGFIHSGHLVTLGWSGMGYMELNIGETIQCPSAMGLFDFATDPAFQGRGFYTDALRQLTSLAGNEGLGSVWIAAHPGNIPSRKGIERAGFRAVRRLSKHRILGVSMLRASPLDQSRESASHVV
jgi:GNAT superfamily N-acetyltransferase